MFVDISKAFDSINHKALLDKLKHMGMSERSLQWFKSYLAERRQCVSINGQTSETQRITLGVPQGSILGPLLFNMYINSLPNAVETRLILYEDDAVLVFPATTPNELQTALEREFGLMSDWYLDNRLTLNVKKTKLMFAGSKTMLAGFEDFLLKRQVRSSKTDPLVDEVELLEANPNYAHVRYPDGRETTVSIKHLAPTIKVSQ